MPQNSLAGDVVVMGVKETDPVNLDESVPPKVSSPFWSEVEFVGAKNMPTTSWVMVPWDNRLSGTVGTVSVLSTVPAMKNKHKKTTK